MKTTEEVLKEEVPLWVIKRDMVQIEYWPSDRLVEISLRTLENKWISNKVEAAVFERLIKMINAENEDDKTELLTTQRMAYRLGVARDWLRKQAEKGTVPSLRAGSRYLFNAASVTKVLADRAAADPVPAAAAVVEKEPEDEDPSPLLTEKEVAEYLAMSPRKVWSLRQSKELRHVTVGRAIRYSLADVKTFIRDHTVAAKK